MKLRSVGIIIVLLAVLLCGLMPAGAALADSTPVVLLSGKTTDAEITVDVILRGNNGISGMLLNLEYDRTKLVLTGLDRGDALASLDLMTTNTKGAEGYAVYPFRLHWSGDANDSTNGKLLTLHFAPIADAEGDATVTFSYERNQDINHIEAGELSTLNLMVDTLHVGLSKDNPPAISSEIEYEEPAEKNVTGLAVGITVGVAVALALSIGLPIWWFKKKNK